MKKLLIAIGVLVFVIVANYSTTYASDTEQVSKFDSQITIAQSDDVTVKETIVYDFASNMHHGIYRDIPIDYHDGNTNYYVNFKLDSVTDENGNSIQTQLSTDSGNKRIKIGDPNTTITGVHTYVISYELKPLIIQKDGKPFLNLDVVGSGWTVPIYNISAKVTLENGAQLSDVSWYGATNQSTTPGELTVDYVAPYQGVTINATLPNGYITYFLQPNKMRTEDLLAAIGSAAIGILIALLILGVAIIFIVRGVRTHRRKKRQIVVAQYEPPKGLTPAHIGLLEDDIADNREVTATVINWAVKGYIKIVYLPKKGLFGSTDYQLVLLKSGDDLPAAEYTLLSSFFGTDQKVKLSQLDKGTMASEVSIFKASIRSDLTKLGYYQNAGDIFMRGTLTDEGAKQWAQVDGFKLYLSVVEKDRLEFSDAPDKTPERFNALLPYAIALGVEKQWAKKFDGIDLTQSTNWYTGNLVAFSAISLASDLGSSFASVMSSNSSVSSGGGVGGGGFGGGGGGSW
ncbi:DUF2207 domain-containing protein [Patescibacteria group bacterium]|nr:MAG: DUF2207 domain-containing protein [Patescibacteria group bacterium]